jgi:hypothetical protein
MEKIRIQNIKTGKVSVITKTAWDLLRRGGNSKVFDVIPMAEKPVKFNVPAEETKVETHIVVESPIEEELEQSNSPESEFVDIEAPIHEEKTQEPSEETTEESPKKRGPKANK